MKQNLIREKSFEFSVKVVKIYKYLQEDKKEFVLSKQLLRSGTSIGANIRESENAESKLDFIHKLSIAQKECDETMYWLDILSATDYLNFDEHEKISDEANSLLKIIRSIILSTKQNLKKNKINYGL